MLTSFLLIKKVRLESWRTRILANRQNYRECSIKKVPKTTQTKKVKYTYHNPIGNHQIKPEFVVDFSHRRVLSLMVVVLEVRTQLYTVQSDSDRTNLMSTPPFISHQSSIVKSDIHQYDSRH
jgi:hypothetical protein